MAGGVDATRPTTTVLEERARRWVRPDRPDGVVLGLTTPEGVTTRGTGVTAAGGQAPDAATLFEIGSVTKVFTALALAVAVVRGEAHLEDPVADLLPDGVAVPSRGGRKVTLAHLATHTSGLPRLPPGLLPSYLTDRGRREDPYAAIGAQELHAALARTRLRARPGRRVRYSNFGAGLLGHALSTRLGTTYEAMLRERVCGPLGLRDTVITLDADQQARLAVGHTRRGRPVAPWHFDALAGGGALRSTATDLLTFLRAQLAVLHAGRGADRDKAAARRAGVPAELAAAMALTHAPRARSLLAGEVALGWMLQRRRGRSARLWHNGGTGGFRSMVVVDAQAGAASVALANASRSVDALGLALVEAAGG